jgi:predicted DsbA family dithiol-disulfide isomerase
VGNYRGEDMAAAIEITNFTDPACPFAYSAEPHRLRLAWTYGDQIAWVTRLVGLSEKPEDYIEKGFTPEKQATSLAKLAAEHGMPVDAGEQPRMTATIVACRAVVAARLHAPERADALLRRLRIHRFSGELIDEQPVIDSAAEEAGLDPAQLALWTAEPQVEKALRDDMAAARAPTPAARALDHKLAGSGDEQRYTCPSFRFLRAVDGRTVDVPGFQPYAAYEVVLANLSPHLERRAPAATAEEVLAWAGEPLATAEVAAVMDTGHDEARTALARVAGFEPVGTDGFWSLRTQAALAA